MRSCEKETCSQIQNQVPFSKTATGSVWYDFGDGTWDYVAAPGDASHTYASPGTYTVKASQNGVWVSTTVTVAGP